jgi:hypothetical protein
MYGGRMKNIIHVHVGKCAGGSVNLGLHELGIHFEELHCDNADIALKKKLQSDNGNNIYLISLRDPISRVISSFNWDKYEKLIVQKSTNPVWNNIYNSFENLEALVSAYGGENKELASLAQLAFEKSNLHMHLGLAWYVPVEIAKSLPPKRTFVLCTESLDKDFEKMLSLFFPDKEFRGPLPKDKDNKGFLGESNIPLPKFLSEASIKKLRDEILKEDYSILNVLKNRQIMSVNY